MAGDCIFCAIVAGEAPASFVTSSERAVAFLDIRPVTPGHTLVIPRHHAVGLTDLDEEDGADLARLGRRIAVAQREAGLATGVNLSLADGEDAGQEVFHTHLHVLPRTRDDGFGLRIDYPPAPDRSALDTLADRLRDTLPA